MRGSRTRAIRILAPQLRRCGQPSDNSRCPSPTIPRRNVQRSNITIFDQTVGSNPFNLFDDRIGLDAAYGRQVRGVDVQALVMKGHDPQSGLPTLGVDSMLTVQGGGASALFSAYRYDGRRPLGPVSDRFWRQALATNVDWGKAEVDLLAQDGREAVKVDSPSYFGIFHRASRA